MAVKFSQFTSTTPNSNTYFAGYNSALGTNVQVSYTDLAASISPGSGTTNYLSKWTSSSALGNSLVFDNGTSVGVNTATPSASYLLDVNGTARILGYTYIDANTSQGGLRITAGTFPELYFYRSTTPRGLVAVSGVAGGYYTGTLANALVLQGSGGVQFVDGGGNLTMSVSNNSLLIGTTTSAGFKLDVSGTFRSTGDANIASGGGNLNVNNFTGTAVGAIRMKVDASNYGLIVQPTTGTDLTQYNARAIVLPDGSGNNFTIESLGTSGTGRFSSKILDFVANSVRAIYIPNSGNVLINTTTDGGFKLDVNGTARINGVLTLGTAPSLQSSDGNTTILMIATAGLQISSDKWRSNTSASSYIQNGYTTKNFVTTNSANANFSSFDFTTSNAFQPTIANIYTQKLINGAMTINNTGANTFHGISISTTDNSASIANNVYAVYADSTLGTNTSATRWAGYFVGRGYFSQVLSIGTTSPNASALLDITSTTKGFLPPRMTGLQAEAIATPSEGLMVYANNGNGVTITSTGWWGYNGTAWVKLN